MDVVKNAMTAESSNDGEFETSTTTAAPASASASPSPVSVLTPVPGDAGTASWPSAVSLVTSFEPMSPVPPMMTSFMIDVLSALSRFDGGETGVRRQETCESRDVAILRGRDEGVEKASASGRTRGLPAAIREVLPSARHDLPRVGLFEPEDIRDRAVRAVERLPQDVGGSLLGRQPLQQQLESGRQRLASFHSQPRICAGIHGLGKPAVDMRLPARACRLPDVDRQSRRRGHQECRSIPNQAAIHRLPAYPDVLYDVLCFHGATEHPVGDAEETRTNAQERREAVVIEWS